MTVPLVRSFHCLADCVGGTPMVRIDSMDPGGKATILAKLEQFNPTGSVKDRAACAMIDAAEKSGRLRPGATIVEATSGNTGIALASLGVQRGYQVVIVMPDSVSLEKVRYIQAFGARVVFTPAVFGMKRAYAESYRLAETIECAFVPDQSKNSANSAAHRRTTGPEIWEGTAGAVDVFLAGVGTGGTLTGVGEFLREKKPEVEIVAVEPAASPVLSGGAPGPHRNRRHWRRLRARHPAP